MPAHETHPNVLPPPSSALRIALCICGNTFCSALAFIFSFLTLGSLVGTFSFTYASTYTCEMLVEYHSSLIVPMFVLYACVDALFRVIVNSRKPLYWPIISGTASFLLFNRIWASTQWIVDFLRETFPGITDVDYAGMMLLPPLCALTIELWGLLFLPRLLGLLPNRFRKVV